MTNLIGTTIRLTEEQKRFVDEKRQNEKGWDFSVWIREKLEEMMYKQSSFLKQKITELEHEKILSGKTYDKEIQRLTEELNSAIEDEKKAKERIQEHKPEKIPYGERIPKNEREGDSQ